MTIDAIAEAFSSHRFADAYPFLADDVQWELVGGPTLHGPDEVRAACEATLSELEGIETEFRRFRTIVGARLGGRRRDRGLPRSGRRLHGRVLRHLRLLRRADHGDDVLHGRTAERRPGLINGSPVRCRRRLSRG